MKQKVLTCTIFLLAFLWGLKKDQIQELFSTATPGESSESAVVDNSIVVEETKAPPLPQLPTDPAVGRAPKKWVQEPVESQPKLKRYVPPANPYAGLNRELKQQSNTSFKEAFGSINRDAISQKELMKKNAYFRKLSNDLEQLQGERPPPESSPQSSDEPAFVEEIETGPPDIEAGAPLIDEAAEVIPEEQLPAPIEQEVLIDELDDLIEDSLP